MDDYTKQVIKHFEIQSDVALTLLETAQVLCPGTWVLEVRMNFDDHGKKVYQTSVSNGDDNVTTSNINLGAALAQLIYHLLNGSVFPLTGNMGQYIHPSDAGWVKLDKGESNEGR